MVRLVPQHGVEVAERLVPPAAFVPLLAGQELVEGRDRRQGVGHATLARGGRRVAQPGEAGRPPQVVGPGRGAPFDRLIEDHQSLLGPRHRLGQDEQQDIAALLHLGLFRRCERQGQRSWRPGAVRARRGEHFQRVSGRLAGQLPIAGQIQAGELRLTEEGLIPPLEEAAIPGAIRFPRLLVGEAAVDLSQRVGGAARRSASRGSDSILVNSLERASRPLAQSFRAKPSRPSKSRSSLSLRRTANRSLS